MQQNETVITINENDQYSINSMTSATSSTYNKGLDRVLLERNIEKLLERNDKPNTSHLMDMLNQSPQMGRLLHQDRSRDPLDMTDFGLSLDNLSPKTKATLNNAVMESLNKETKTTSSMPELPVYEMLKMDDITPINEELPTPDISAMAGRRDEPTQPVCK
jgi:hypothetical protein